MPNAADDFLVKMERSRALLASNVALRNRYLSERELNVAVQRTLDRLVFLRICEERGTANLRRLSTLRDGVDIYPRMLELFAEADEIYRSGLFHCSRQARRSTEIDTLTPGLTIDDAPLREILQRLHGPHDAAGFAVMPPDILGQVYERFLGSTIRLTANGEVSIEQKPELRKAGGVYYTPSYIVRYIVEQSIGRLIVGRDPAWVAKLRILDPACGAGSFLLGAFQYLMDWHLDAYVAAGGERHTRGRQPRLFRTASGEWRLTSGEKARILLNNIHGVDIDRQAVEVSRLSLLLGVLEDEGAQSVGRNLKLFRERALPDLDRNIKHGNSLGDAFDWKTEFPETKPGGFDVVIGNPPYLKEYTYRQPFEDVKRSKLAHYYQGKMDLWYLFACLGVDLLRPGGVLALIGTNNWPTSAGAQKLRRKLINETALLRFVDFGDFKVFQRAGIQTAVFVVEKFSARRSSPPATTTCLYYRVLQPGATPASVGSALDADDLRAPLGCTFSAMLPAATNGEAFTFVDEPTQSLLEKIESVLCVNFDDRDIAQGIVLPQETVNAKQLKQLGQCDAVLGDGIFLLSADEVSKIARTARERELVKPYFTTAQLGRYRAEQSTGTFLLYTTKATEQDAGCPNLRRHLDRFGPIITSSNRPYGLHRPRDPHFFEGDKIVALRKTARPQFSFTDFPCYVSQTFNIIKPRSVQHDLRFLTGLLNSRLAHFWFLRRGKLQGVHLQIDKAPLLKFPIPTTGCRADFEAIRDAIISLVERRNRMDASTEQADATEAEIDALVYRLFGLDVADIEHIEGATAATARS